LNRRPIFPRIASLLVLVIALSPTIGGADEETWWAYQPVQRPAVPEIEDLTHPIDAFIAARLARDGLAMSETASRRVLMRRAYLGLHGLPPDLEQQRQFLEDDSPRAWLKLLDELLESKHYGERWARYWLDLVRYADSNGYERDAKKPKVWKYRDYVIRALNEDKPYDRFVIEQLAGDELEDSSTETFIATGYWALGAWNDEVDPLEQPQYRADELDDLVMTTSQTFLASTLSCARCHDHKFDPLTADDYYSMVSIVDPLKRGNLGRTDLAIGVGNEKSRKVVEKRDEKLLPIQNEIYETWKPYRKKYFEEHESEFKHSLRQTIAAVDKPPKERNQVDWRRVRDEGKQWDKMVSSLVPEDELKKIETLKAQASELRQKIPDLPKAYVLFENSPNAPPTYFLKRGNPAAKEKTVQPAVPAVMTTTQPQFLPTTKNSTRRRLSFARWITSPDNPMTARVIVNRVWQHHFGTGIVSTPSDFGRVGARPTHPKLLDWLASWFVHDAGWSLKKLHRMILSSRTYQMSSKWTKSSAEKDPANTLLWRFPYQRLDVEATRDSMLAVSGALNKEMGGHGVYFHIPAVVIEGHATLHDAWKEDPEVARNRRTIYGFVKRALMVPMIEALDFCDTIRSTARRSVTTIPPQSLILFNGEFVNRQAKTFAERLRKEAGNDPEKQIKLAYRLALARAPTPSETKAMHVFLTEESEGLVQLCRAILNLNEFVYVD